MSEWITITEAKLRAGKASDLVDAYATAALGVGQEEPIDQKIANAVETIRLAIANGRRTRLSATPGSIPRSLEDLAVRLICWNLQSRINVLESLEPTKQDVIDHASDERKLERLETGVSVVEDPDNPIGESEVSGGAIATTIGDRPRATERSVLASI